MKDRLFYVETSHGVRKNYSDLLGDIGNTRSIPKVFWSTCYYEIFTMLLAALSGDLELALSQEALRQPADEAIPSPDRLCCSAKRRVVEQPELPSTLFTCCHLDFLERIGSSTSEIGVFTSGTTGRPKIIRHRMDTLIRSVKKGESHRDDVWGLTYHPASFAGLQVFFQAVCNSNSLIRLTGLGPSDVHATIRNEGVTHLSATPTWMRLICSDAVVHKHVLSITTGGEITDRWLIQQIASTFPNAKFRNMYASTESGALLISNGDSFRVPNALSELIVVRDGMLAIHRSLLAESLRHSDDSEFYATGDCVEVISNEPLTLRFTARESDWINVGGHKVNPHEIEQMLTAIDGVADARVFGRRNSVTGSIVCCEIVRTAGESIKPIDIRRGLAKQVASFMIPRIIEFVDAIDKTPIGKKNRSE